MQHGAGRFEQLDFAVGADEFVVGGVGVGHRGSDSTRASPRSPAKQLGGSILSERLGFTFFVPLQESRSWPSRMITRKSSARTPARSTARSKRRWRACR